MTMADFRFRRTMTAASRFPPTTMAASRFRRTTTAASRFPPTMMTANSRFPPTTTTFRRQPPSLRLDQWASRSCHRLPQSRRHPRPQSLRLLR
jgi:hypothetical protein